MSLSQGHSRGPGAGVEAGCGAAPLLNAAHSGSQPLLQAAHGAPAPGALALPWKSDQP